MIIVLTHLLPTGLNGAPDSISFESQWHGFYLACCVISGSSMYVVLRDIQYPLSYDFTWYIRQDKFFPGTVAFESSRYASHFMRHQSFYVKIAAESSLVKSVLSMKDASFRFDGERESSFTDCFLCLGFLLTTDL